MTEGPLTVLALFGLILALAIMVAYVVGSVVAQALGAL